MFIPVRFIFWVESTHEVVKKLGWTDSASLLERGDFVALKWYTQWQPNPAGWKLAQEMWIQSRCFSHSTLCFFHLKIWLFKRVDEPNPRFCQFTIAWNYHALSLLIQFVSPNFPHMLVSNYQSARGCWTSPENGGPPQVLLSGNHKYENRFRAHVNHKNQAGSYWYLDSEMGRLERGSQDAEETVSV